MPGPDAKVVIKQNKPPFIQNLANISENDNRNQIIEKKDSWDNFETPQDQVDQPVVEFGQNKISQAPASENNSSECDTPMGFADGDFRDSNEQQKPSLFARQNNQ